MVAWRACGTDAEHATCGKCVELCRVIGLIMLMAMIVFEDVERRAVSAPYCVLVAMSDKAGEERPPLTAAGLRAARLRCFMPDSAQAEPEHAPPSAAEPEPVVSSAPVYVSPSAAVTAESASSSPHELEQQGNPLARELHNIYMATWPVCVEMAQALRGISDLSCFKGLSIQDLKQTLLTYYAFNNILKCISSMKDVFGTDE
jgi:hypothetical protein